MDAEKSQRKSAKICGKKTIIPLIAQMDADRRRKRARLNLRKSAGENIIPRITQMIAERICENLREKT